MLLKGGSHRNTFVGFYIFDFDMHVLHFLLGFHNPIGGEEIFVRGLTYHLQAKYGIVQSIITQSSSRRKEISRYEGITVISLPMLSLGYYNVLSGLFSVLYNGTYDIINIHGYGDYTADITCILKKLGFLGNTPLVLSTHGLYGLKNGYLASDFSAPFPSKRQRIRGFLHRFYDFTLGRVEVNTFDKIIINSEEDRKYLSKNGMKGNKAVKIPIAINEIFFRFKPAIPRSDRHYILYVGRIDPYKGLDVLVKAIKELESRGTIVKCIIIGSDVGYKSKLLSFIHKMNIQDQVELREHVSQENLIELYSHAIVTVLPSLSEGYPLTLVESLSAGTPFITTPVGANPELASLSNAGLIVPIGEPKTLADTILRAIKDEHLWLNMSRCGQAYVVNFSWQKVVEKYYQVYSELTQ